MKGMRYGEKVVPIVLKFAVFLQNDQILVTKKLFINVKIVLLFFITTQLILKKLIDEDTCLVLLAE